MRDDYALGKDRFGQVNKPMATLKFASLKLYLLILWHCKITYGNLKGHIFESLIRYFAQDFWKSIFQSGYLWRLTLQ